jgi:prevent-host-death family protein
MAETVNVYEAKTHLSKLISRVEAGEEITLSRNGRAVAKIVPLSWKAIVRRPGSLEGQIVIHDDFDEFTEQDDRDWYGE